MPSTITGPGPPIEAPLAFIPLTVSNSRFVSNSQSIDPSLVEKARMPPSNEPEKTTPGIALIAADCAALQPGALAHFNGGGGANQVRSPVASLTACSPPGGWPALSSGLRYSAD